MRTTLAIDDDVLAAARHLAEREGKTMVYHLLRQDVKPVIAALRDTFCTPMPDGKHG